ncbi:hypothetical protein ABC955_10315 [Citromicrobium bathyomarinum]
MPSPTFNAFRMINDGERVALHRVSISPSGELVAMEREPATFAATADTPGWGRISIGADLTSAVMASVATEPLLLRDGKLIDAADHGGDEARPAKAIERAKELEALHCQ